MSDFFIGEIRMFAFNWAPVYWALCNGAQMQTQQNQALNALLGGRFGGNGSTTFNLPDLRGRVPLCWGTKYPYQYNLGSTGGAETVPLTTNTLPTHNHPIQATTNSATKPSPAGNFFGAITNATTSDTATHPVYVAPTSAVVPLNPGTIGATGDGQPHANMQPYTVGNFCISTTGLFPPHS